MHVAATMADETAISLWRERHWDEGFPGSPSIHLSVRTRPLLSAASGSTPLCPSALLSLTQITEASPLASQTLRLGIPASP